MVGELNQERGLFPGEGLEAGQNPDWTSGSYPSQRTLVVDFARPLA